MNNYNDDAYYTIKDNHMFATVMSDEEILKELLRRIFPEKKIDKLEIVGVKEQRHFEDLFNFPNTMVHAEDDENIYNIEMLRYVETEHLLARSRCYQANLDMLAFMNNDHYYDLKNNNVIFVCDSDPFGDKQYKYTFKSACVDGDVDLNYGQTTIFLNTRGEKGEISEGLKEFLEYVRDEKMRLEDNYLKNIDELVKNNNEDSRWRRLERSLEITLENAEARGESRAREKGDF